MRLDKIGPGPRGGMVGMRMINPIMSQLAMLDSVGCATFVAPKKQTARLSIAGTGRELEIRE